MNYLTPYAIAQDLGVSVRCVRYWIAKEWMFSSKFSARKRLVKEDYFRLWKRKKYPIVRAALYKETWTTQKGNQRKSRS